MRKEASLELWKKLYERAKEIDDLAPWQYVSASNLISIVSENRKDPVFLNITGMGTDFRSVNLYQGLEGYGDYHMAATVGQTDLTDDYVMFEQNVLTLYWNSMMDVSPEQREIIDQLDVKFHDLGSWMEFVSQKKRFWPHLPDEEEVKLLIDAYENLIMVIRAVRDKKIDLDLEQRECIYRVYDKETGKWNMFVDAQPDMEKQFPAVQLNEEDLKKQLQEKPQTDAELIMDFSYAGFPAQDEAYDQPVHPLMFIAVDSTRKEVLEAYFLSPDDGEIEAALNFFIAYVERHGRMKRIKARNPWIFGALADTCALCQVELVHDPIQEADAIEQDIKRRAQSQAAQGE